VDEAAARAELEMLVQADIDPALDANEITQLLAAAHRVTPDGDQWDVRAAARAGWMLKAAKASARYTFTTDGQTFQRGMTFAQCTEMADRYRPRGLRSQQAAS